MGMQYDVKAKYTASNAVLVDYRARLKAIFFSIETAGATPISFYDNASTATGTAVFSVGTTGTGGNTVLIPGEGVLFENGIAVNVGDADNVTVFYG
jgi:hypothetical protein